MKRNEEKKRKSLRKNDLHWRRGESNLETWICKCCFDKHLCGSAKRAWRPAWRCSAATRVSPSLLRPGHTFLRPVNGLSLRRWANIATQRGANRCHGVTICGTMSRAESRVLWTTRPPDRRCRCQSMTALLQPGLPAARVAKTRARKFRMS